jgi:exonuclease III
LDYTADKTTGLCGDQLDMHIYIQGIAKHKQDTHQFTIRQTFEKSARKVFDKHVIELGSTQLRTVTSYKPGSTGLIAQGNIVGYIITHRSNKYGRWSSMHLTGSDNQVITIIQVYQVFNQPTNEKCITAYHQQETAFRSEHRTDPNPRINFKKDLTRFLKTLQARNHHIILLGNFNEHIQEHRSSLQAISLDCQLIDIWKRRFPQSIELATYLQGSKRIDYVLISPAIEPAVLAVGYESFHHNIPTDHRGIFIDFDTQHLFGAEHNPMVSARHRDLKSSMPQIASRTSTKLRNTAIPTIFFNVFVLY